ncbi:hypothetical protein JCM21900_002584 [Sporobolomyces salmonicolor]
MSADRRDSESLEVDYGDVDLIGTDYDDVAPPPSPPGTARPGSGTFSQAEGSAEVGQQEAKADALGQQDGTISGGGVKSDAAAAAAVAPNSLQPIQSIETSGTGSLPAAPNLPANPLTGRPPGVSGPPVPTATVTGGGASKMTAVYVGELHWWTTDANIVELAQLAGVTIKLRDVSFSEHKVNGRSKGVAFVDTGAGDKAVQIKRYVDSNDFQGKRMSAQLAYGGSGSPFKTLPKEPFRPHHTSHSHVAQPSQPQSTLPHRPNSGMPARPPPSSTHVPHHQYQQQKRAFVPPASTVRPPLNQSAFPQQPQQQQQPQPAFMASPVPQPTGMPGMGAMSMSPMSMPMPMGMMGLPFGGGMDMTGMYNGMNGTGFGGMGGALNPAFMGAGGFGGAFDMTGGAGMGAFGGMGMDMTGGLAGGGLQDGGVARKRARMDG